MDFLERPPADPSVETYIESFCQLLDDSWTLTNLDSGDIQAAEPPVWPDDLMDLHDLLEDMSPEDWEQLMGNGRDSFDLDAFDSLSLEDMVDLLEDMSPEDWEQLMEDMSFDLDAFVS